MLKLKNKNKKFNVWKKIYLSLAFQQENFLE